MIVENRLFGLPGPPRSGRMTTRYQPPPLDPGAREALDAFAARRKQEPAPVDH
jgi:hypothetical protein